ncbi:MAG: hypothetical protein AAFV59_07545 [Pseudomonadota bacterium]
MTIHGKMNPVAAFFLYGGLGLIVLSFVVISGIANVNVWYNSAQGWARYVFTVVGIGAEGWGALGLLLLSRRLFQRQWLKALICFALWVPAVGFNGYSTYRFFVIEGSAVNITGETEKTALSLAEDRIEEITSELTIIGVTRTPEAIRSERDQLPENYRTRRGELDAELATAERRTSLETELAENRQTVLEKAGADLDPGEKTISNENIWIALIFWMEAIKALALWVMFGRTEGRKTEEGALPVPTEETPSEVAPGAPVVADTPAQRVITDGDGKQRLVRVV